MYEEICYEGNLRVENTITIISASSHKRETCCNKKGDTFKN